MIIKREGSWRLVSVTPEKGYEHLMDVHSLDPFITLWRYVKEELDFFVALAAVTGDAISINMMPKANRIEVIRSMETGSYTTIYECQPI